jgi:hypothetical protein
MILHFRYLVQSVFFKFWFMTWRVILAHPGLHDQAEVRELRGPNLDVSQGVNSGMVDHIMNGPDAGNPRDTYWNDLVVEALPAHFDGYDSSFRRFS